MREPSGRLVLDTHVWLWLASDAAQLSAQAHDAIERAATDGALHVAAISTWEAAMLDARGRIALAMPCGEWVEEALAVPGLSLAPLSPQIAVESCRLPGRLHDDPVDRMIIATARLLDATLVTRDARILRYGLDGHVRALEA
ncbi:MAG: type II toxin-antitoxin system VapC family toxin [Alphaproteobacteria bacterium]